MSRLARDGTAEPVSRDQIIRRERGQENIHFPCSADREQDWQRYPVDLLIVLYILSAVNADGVWRVKVNIWTPPWKSGGIP